MITNGAEIESRDRHALHSIIREKPVSFSIHQPLIYSMITNGMTAVAGQSDIELVVQSLDGNRDAFGQIVVRYQSLVCSLAYSATGSVAQSEDLAQDTFVTAWRRLANLREPEKLRAWLCGIARNLINNWRRREGREPSHHAESLETIHESPASEPLPVEQTISREEEAVLWRSMERIPEIYREPLVLFYREHQSAGRVAQALELSEDAVHQRLSRGRKLLQEQVLAFVEGTLERTRPGKAFTLGVLAALPLLTSTAKAATATVAIKGGSTVKAASSFAMLGAVLSASVLFFFSLLGFFIFTGACVGYMMGRSCSRSAKEFTDAIRFWRALAAGFLGIVMPLWMLLDWIPKPALYHTWLSPLTWIMALFYPLFFTTLTVWIVRWWLGLRHPNAETGPFSRRLKKRFALWFILGMAWPAFICAGLLYSMFQSTWTTQTISVAQAQNIIIARKDAQVTVTEYNNGYKELLITLPESARRVDFYTRPDDATLALLAKSGLKYQTRVEGVDFVETGAPWRLLFLLSISVASMGGAVLAQRPWKHPSFSREAVEIQRDERIAKGAFKAFAVSVALVMLAGGLLIGLISWKPFSARRISDAEAQKAIAEFAGYKNARFEVFQFSNGSSELWISRERNPDYIAPADAATLSLLKEKGIGYKTYVQGKDFGYNFPPNKATALALVLVLVAGAGMILWWVTPKAIAVCVALLMLAVCIVLGLVTPWHVKSVSAAEAQRLIIEHKSANFEVYQYKNGASQLIITPRSRVRRHGSIAGWRAFIAPATDSTLALLATNKIPYHTSVQGRDFGYGVPNRGTSFLWISFLTMGAAGILWWVIKKPHRTTKVAAAVNGA